MKALLMLSLMIFSFSSFANVKECGIFTDDVALENELMLNRYRIATEDSADLRINFESKEARLLGGKKTTVSIVVEAVSEEKTLKLYSASLEVKKFLSFRRDDATASMKARLLSKALKALKNYNCRK